MVGSAVAMMVWFSAARNAASIRPKKMVRTSAWLIGPAELMRQHATGCAAGAIALGDAARAGRERSIARGRAPARPLGKTS